LGKSLFNFKFTLQAFLFGYLLIVEFPAFSSDHNSHPHEQKPHVHGIANMELVIHKQAILLTVHSPLYNLLGFEHKPKLAEQKQAVKLQLDKIKAGNLITFNTAAKCEVKAIHYEHPFETNDHHSNEHKGHKGHKDINFEYELLCHSPNKLAMLNSEALFSAWKNLNNLRVQWIGQGKQSAVTLNRNKTQFSLK